MKKVTSISLALLIIIAILHLSVANHFCGGKFTASKVSITGKLANCGMEDFVKELPLPGITFSKHCCDDDVISISIDNNYTPSYPIVQKSILHNFQILSIFTGYPVHPIAVSKSIYTSASPPGAFMSTNVDITNICNFRI